MLQRVGRGGSVDVESRPSRLCVARISVVRGEAGDRCGEAAMDDYIRMVEPVYDYLTKFSGLVAGDLDPHSSPHYLTTLKVAYTKLQYLIDVGCIFVGHGLRNDFRLINLVVPPQQVIDTVQLFHLKQQRYLSLRYLASYLLGLDIQTDSHDSIEDARTALKLYEVYKRLVAEGTFEETLLAMYRWGNEHGWSGAGSTPEHRAQTPPPPAAKK